MASRLSRENLPARGIVASVNERRERALLQGTMMYRLFELLNANQVARLRELARGATWVDGRTSNPTNSGKKNEQIKDGAAREESGAMLANALGANNVFNDFALPVAVALPLLSRYLPGMGYALHGDNAYLPLGNLTIRNDLACTIFLADPASYDGGALVIHSGDVRASFKLPAGHAILYPANTPHEVEQVTRGERLAVAAACFPRGGAAIRLRRVAPFAQQILLHHQQSCVRRRVEMLAFASCDGPQFRYNPAPRWVGDPALDEGECRQSLAAGHLLDLMRGVGRVEDGMARGQLE